MAIHRNQNTACETHELNEGVSKGFRTESITK